MSQKLDWFGELDEVRRFFETNKLVQKYDTRELISNVSRIQRETKDKITRRQALHWLYSLYVARGEEAGDSLAAADIFVPVGKESWVSAKSAYFSKGWNHPSKINHLLEQFFEKASHYSSEIAEQKRRLLHQPSKKPFSTGKPTLWYAFLKRIGVKTGMHPKKLETKSVKAPRDISIRNLNTLLNLDSFTQEIWEADTETRKPRHSSGDFKLNENKAFWWWPGQGDFESFPPEVKKMNARLFLEWLAVSEFSLDSLQVEYSHHAYYVADRFTWTCSSPLLAFLRQGKWFPVENARSEGKGTVFKNLKEVWLPEEEKDWPRRFMPQICSDNDIRKTVALDIVRMRLSSWGNANVLNDQNCIHDQISFLGKLFNDAQIDEYYKREFINLYIDSWKMLANLGGNSWKPHTNPEWLITRGSGVFRSYRIQDDHESSSEIPPRNVYVQDDGKTLVCTLLDELGQDVFDFGPGDPCTLEILKELLGPAFVGTSGVPVSIVIDGAPVTSLSCHKKLLVEIVPAFPALLCLAMECLTGASAQRLPPDRGEMVARLRQVRIVTCHRISFDVSGKITPIPYSNYGVFSHIEENIPYLILEADNERLSWAHLRQAGPALSRLLNQPNLAPEIRSACSGMERLEAQVSDLFDRAIHLDGLCRELNLGKIQADTALAIEVGDKNRIERLLRPLVHYFCGSQAVADYDQMRERSITLDDLLLEAESLFEDIGTSFRKLYDQVKESYEYDTIRKDLNLDFASFNKSLIETEGLNSAITYPEDHIITMKVYLEENRDQLVAYLQSYYLNTFDEQADLTEFVDIKNQLFSLNPDNAWLLDYEVPPQEVMTVRVHEWLEQRGFSKVESIDPIPDPWSITIKKNEKTLKKFIHAHLRTISLWCDVNSASVGSWTTPELALNTIKLALDKIGAMDFRELGDHLLISWMVKAGVWPDGMPESLDLGVLGLTEEKLREKEQEASEKRAEQDKVNRSVKFGSNVLDPRDIDYEALSDEMKLELPKDFLNTSLGIFSDIHKIEKKARSGGSVHGKGSHVSRLPQEKTEFIGFLGECAVYHWLKKLFPNKDIDSSWKSENREHLCAGKGEDSLGYDFQLEYKHKNWYLEVKASLQDPMMFEMGETEVEKAKEVAVSKKGLYTVIYVSNLEDPSRMRLLVLPNPFTEEGKKVFGPPREKFRYSFGE